MMNCPRCDKPIDEHEAGRDTDACVAKVVMGETPFQPRDRYAGISYGDKWFLEAAYPNFPGASMPHYSLYIAAAWEIVEKKGYSIWCAGGPDEWVWGAGYWDWEDGKRDLLVYALADTSAEERLSPMCPTVQLAICRAALKATVKKFA